MHPNLKHVSIIVGALGIAVEDSIWPYPPLPRRIPENLIEMYGWGGKSVEKLTGLLDNLEVELLSPVLSKGHPGADERVQLGQLAAQIAQKHHEIGLQ